MWPWKPARSDASKVRHSARQSGLLTTAGTVYLETLKDGDHDEKQHEERAKSFPGSLVRLEHSKMFTGFFFFFF